MSITIFESLLVGVGLNVNKLSSKTSLTVQNNYKIMLDDQEFSEEKLKEGLSGKARVKGRLQAARRAFAN